MKPRTGFKNFCLSELHLDYFYLQFVLNIVILVIDNTDNTEAKHISLHKQRFSGSN